MKKITPASPLSGQTSKPSKWSRIVAAIGNAIGQAKFGQ